MTGIFDGGEKKLKVQVRDLAREGENTVGVFRYIDDAGRLVVEHPFTLKLCDAALMTSSKVEEYALSLDEPRVKAAFIEAEWAEVQRVFEPLLIKVETVMEAKEGAE